MITEAIINFFVTCINFLLNLFPSFTGLDSLIGFKNQFIEMMIPTFSHVLWFFNPSILKIAFLFLIGFYGFLVSEYLFKLVVKYVTRLL